MQNIKMTTDDLNKILKLLGKRQTKSNRSFLEDLIEIFNDRFGDDFIREEFYKWLENRADFNSLP